MKKNHHTMSQNQSQKPSIGHPSSPVALVATLPLWWPPGRPCSPAGGSRSRHPPRVIRAA